MEPSLIAFFDPRGVVIVGASSSPEKLGYGAARNLIQSGYPGAIHFVSQKAGTLFERPLYTDLAKVPDPVDLAVLIVPPQVMPETLEACAKRDIKAAIIVTSGFREAGAEGATLEKQCLEIARTNGMRFLGPNCIGTIDTHLPLDTTFLQPPMPTKGGIGFISHSGAFCAAIIDWARLEGFGFSQVASLGNQADVNETDMLPMLAADEHTRIIVLYMEGVSDGIRFMDTARAVTQKKPVVALKVGRFESGQKAAASHTGALAASDIAFAAAFEKAGILRADTTQEMFEWARALEVYPRGLDTPRLAEDYSTGGDHGIAVLTNAGGPGVIAADSLEQHGLLLAKLSDSTLKALSTHLPPAASVQNPVDMLASASPDTYAACLKILLDDPNVDAVMIVLPPPPMFKAEDVAEKLVEIISAQGSILAAGDGGLSRDKPIVIALTGSTLIENAAEIFQRANIPTYPFPERAASAFSALAKRADYLRGLERLQTLQLNNGDKSKVLSKRSAPRKLWTSEELIQSYGLKTAPIKLARDEKQAITIANELGFPVVMKIASPDILHKSDVGGVLLNIQDIESLRSGYTKMIDAIKSVRSEAKIEGVHLQRQIVQGQDVIAGMVRDEQFGPLMMFGSGGVEVEGLKDVAFALAPLNQAEARQMIRKTWAGRKLQGFRDIPPADEESAIDVLVKLSQLAMENENIQELEINPLRVLSAGAIALDIRTIMNQME